MNSQSLMLGEIDLISYVSDVEGILESDKIELNELIGRLEKNLMRIL